MSKFVFGLYDFAHTVGLWLGSVCPWLPTWFTNYGQWWLPFGLVALIAGMLNTTGSHGTYVPAATVTPSSGSGSSSTDTSRGGGGSASAPDGYLDGGVGTHDGGSGADGGGT